jgi:hypothetical protein
VPKPPKPPSGKDVEAYARWRKAQQQSGAALTAWAETQNAQKRVAPKKKKTAPKKKRGAPRDYPHEKLRAIALDLLKRKPDEHLETFCERVRGTCGVREINLPPAPKNPKQRNRTIASVVGDLYWNAKQTAS